MAGTSLLIVNPNTSKSMTSALKPLIEQLGYPTASYTFFTAPSGPSSINDNDDAAESLHHCLPPLLPLLPRHAGVLVACYSEHPLVGALQARTQAPVLGIFGASVTTALNLLAPSQKFGIVSTGRVWEELLTRATGTLLGSSASTSTSRLAGVQTTGLTAGELHELPERGVRAKMVDATRRLVQCKDVMVVCLGCAGMSGMGEMVREACVAERGTEEGERVRIVDGVVAGVAILEGLIRAGF